MEVRIYQPTQSAMQTGSGGGACKWLLEFESTSGKQADSLMGWVGGSTTYDQVKMKFESKESAIAFAERKGLTYQVIEPKPRKVKIRNYADNYAYNRVK
ncbi:MAG: ETC complex I subunit [Rhodospirillales bacterium]|nr:ETC complex I subunit [Rhodospirillales bacterium]